MFEIRVFAGTHAACGEPDLAFRIVDLDDVAHDPVTCGDAVLHASGPAIDQIEVVPAIALGRPDDLVAEPVHIVREAPVGKDEGPGVLGDSGMRHAACGIDCDHTRLLKAAPHIVERDARAVLAPARRRQFIGVGKQRGVDHRLAMARDIEQHRLFLIDRVARLGIELTA